MANRAKNPNPVKAAAGRKGGQRTFEKYGRDHMSAIGKIGYKVTTSRYQVLPGRINEWLMVRREDNKIVSVWR